MKFFTILAFICIAFATDVSAIPAAGPDHRLHFREGEIRRVTVNEVLRLMMHFPQVETNDAKPSVRTSQYSFTESVEKVLSDGSAIIAASLDSFTTLITIGEGRDAEDFFHFNSAIEWDIAHTLHDIKTLPRAQFLGQTLRFTMRPDGTVHDFQNLSAFHDNAVGKGYDYDMVHAMLSVSDSLRIGQLLELGAAGLAGEQAPYNSASTATEIPMSRTVTATQGGKETIRVIATYFNPPQKIDYLEGIATPMGVLGFHGGGAGEIVMKNGFLMHSTYRDTANVVLAVDIDTVPEEITRIVTTNVFSVPVLHGSKISIQEIEVHHGIHREPAVDTTNDVVPIESPVEDPKRH
jgi:hypothetical protein